MYVTGVLLCSLLLLGYCFLILQYRKWFIRLAVFKPDRSLVPQTRFSVIIPARNEADVMEPCLQSILEQDYPSELFEVLVVNDHSTDQTVDIITALQGSHPNLHLIHLADHIGAKALNAYKKKAIELAIAQSTGEWMVTTDADCMAQKGWLREYDHYIQQHQPVFIAAPVLFTNDGSLLSVFQLLDFMSLQGITAAAVSAGFHSMCNGANLAYQKTVFNEVGQFKGIDGIASGDDMLLMHKIRKRYPEGMGYLFSQTAVVTTPPMADWKSFFNQRIRWASKATQYEDAGIFRTLLLVYVMNAGLLVLLLFRPVEGLLLLLIKALVELSFMLPVSRFFEQRRVLFWFIPMQPLHLLYTVVAGWLGKFGTYHWKGRSVR